MLKAVVLVASLSFSQSAHTISLGVVAPFISVTALHIQDNRRSTTDTISLSETLVMTVSIAQTDSVTMTDEVSLAPNKAVGDGVTMGDSLTMTTENSAISGSILHERILNG